MALTLFRPASGSGVAPRPKGWIAAAAASLLSARALAPEESGQGMTLRRRELVSHSSPLFVAGDGDAGCKYIELSVLVLVCNAWWVNVADGLLCWSTARGQQSKVKACSANEGKQQWKAPETARLRWWREAPVSSLSLCLRLILASALPIQLLNQPTPAACATYIVFHCVAHYS